MMLYLTGALDSLAKSDNCPQTDTKKSLGGYVSSTPCPNASVNALFDLISMQTIAEKTKETIAIGLINKFDKAVTDVNLKMVVEEDAIASYKVAAVMLDKNYGMEHITSSYGQPINAEFYDATFKRACCDIKITQPASEGEEIALFPFDVQIEVERGGIEGTWEAWESAFSNDSTYDVKRVTENVFRIVRRDETVVTEFGVIDYVATSGFKMEPINEFKNRATASVSLFDEGETLEPGQGIGLWIQREIKSYRYTENEQLIEDWKNHKIANTVEEVSMVISYNSVEQNEE